MKNLPSFTKNPIAGKSLLRAIPLVGACASILLAVSTARSADIEMSGTIGWSLNGGYMTLEVPRIDNNSSSGTSGTLRLQLWVTSSRYTGGTITGYVVATSTLGTLGYNQYYSNVSRTVAYDPPPYGVYYTTMTVEEYTGASLNDGYSIVDYITFDNTNTFGNGGGSGGDLYMSGSAGWSTSGGTLTIEVDQVDNDRSTTSGTLRLQLWATSSPYGGGQISGYILGTASLGTLSGYHYLPDISKTVSYNPPPSGTYYTTITLEEYTGADGYLIVDYHTFSTTRYLGGSGGGGGTPPGDGGVTVYPRFGSGSAAWRTRGTRVRLTVPQILNQSSVRTTGTLQVYLTAHRSRAAARRGGGGRTLAVTRYGQLSPNYYYHARSTTVRFRRPKGRFFTAMVLAEYTGGYTARDTRVFPRRVRFR